ncbi:MAG: manganese-dependent inorganic pyrophosphatase, partial [Paenibacillus sp.]|nr:manganese-dependent inorganic pyrophosphatase [Paenibacillus sp.]
LSDKSVAELITLDSKEFTMGSSKVEIAQVNAVDVQDVLSREAEVTAALNQVIADKGLDVFVFVVTDILNNDSVAIVLGSRTDAVEQAFNVKLADNKAVLKGVVSRKSQVVPVLTDILSK